jgi:hypothetical protein
MPGSVALAVGYILIAGYPVVLVAVGMVLRQTAPDPASSLFGSPLTGEITGLVTLTLRSASTSPYRRLRRPGRRGASGDFVFVSATRTVGASVRRVRCCGPPSSSRPGSSPMPPCGSSPTPANSVCRADGRTCRSLAAGRREYRERSTGPAEVQALRPVAGTLRRPLTFRQVASDGMTASYGMTPSCLPKSTWS